MSDKKVIDIKSFSKELESLIDIAGDSCGPLLIKKLQERMDKTIDTFNKDVKKMLESSFEMHQDKINSCKEILNSRKTINHDKDFEKDEINSPKFIQSYEKNKKT